MAIGRRRARWRRAASMHALVRRVRPVVHTPRTGTCPGWGLPAAERTDHRGLAPEPVARPFEQALEFHHRGHDVLAMDYASGRVHQYLVEVRTPRVPRLRISARRPAGLVYDGTDLAVRVAGHPQFDDAFQVVTDDPAFAETVLHGPLVRLLVTDRRYRDKFVEFKEGTVYSEFYGRLPGELVLANADMLIDVVLRVPPHAWEFRTEAR